MYFNCKTLCKIITISNFKIFNKKLSKGITIGIIRKLCIIILSIQHIIYCLISITIKLKNMLLFTSHWVLSDFQLDTKFTESNCNYYSLLKVPTQRYCNKFTCAGNQRLSQLSINKHRDLFLFLTTQSQGINNICF